MDCFSPYNFRPEVDNDVISGMAEDKVCMDVPIKFCDSRANGFRDIRGADFASNEQTLAQAFPNSTFRLSTNPSLIKIIILSSHCTATTGTVLLNWKLREIINKTTHISLSMSSEPSYDWSESSSGHAN